MNGFLLPLLVVSIYQEALTASISNHDTLPDDVKYNLIGYEDEIIEGMTPPRQQAPDHYGQGKSLREPEAPYVVEITRQCIKFKTTGFPPQIIKLSQNESEGIQKLSLDFVKLLNSSKLSSQGPETETEDVAWEDLNPVITISHSGISMRFVNATEPEDGEEGEEEEEEEENKDIFWDFLSKYVRNVFEAKVKELKVGEEYADVIGTLAEGEGRKRGFEAFESALWKVMRLSVDYAETAFQGWTSLPEETTTRGEEEDGEGEEEGSEGKETHRGTVTTVFAYEEPSPFHVFPSQELEHRRKDVDSIFYGRGIV